MHINIPILFIQLQSLCFLGLSVQYLVDEKEINKLDSLKVRIWRYLLYLYLHLFVLSVSLFLVSYQTFIAEILNLMKDELDIVTSREGL